PRVVRVAEKPRRWGALDGAPAPPRESELPDCDGIGALPRMAHRPRDPFDHAPAFRPERAVHVVEEGEPSTSHGRGGVFAQRLEDVRAVAPEPGEPEGRERGECEADAHDARVADLCVMRRDADRNEERRDRRLCERPRQATRDCRRLVEPDPSDHADGLPIAPEVEPEGEVETAQGNTPPSRRSSQHDGHTVVAPDKADCCVTELVRGDEDGQQEDVHDRRRPVRHETPSHALVHRLVRRPTVGSFAVINPTLTEMATYPFVRLEEARRRLVADGVEVIDFGKGDPNEPTDPMIRQALIDALPERSPYPLAQGLPELREAAARWCGTRFGVDLDPDTEIVPTYGSKEAIFSLAQVLDTAGRTVVFGAPAYPVYERGALFAGAEVQTLPLLRENGFLPDLDAIPDDTALLWVNYPHNPTGAVAPLDFYERLTRLAAERGFYVGSDEAYTELWFDAPPPSALQAADRSRMIVFQTLSKRSSMTGYRSGFVAAPPEVIAALKAYRPTVGTAPQEFVQRASVVAWNDERHVEETRTRYRAKRDVMIPAIESKGWEIVASDATM